jgi:hypothetical protein
MKVIRYVVPTAIVVLALVACLQSTTPTEVPPAEPTANVPLTVQAAVDATLVAQPTDTPGPDVQATVEVAVQATLTAEASSAAEEVASARERAYRSYPAPTGFPGFRRYYQKRCYPGCHYDAAQGTPTPQATHP